MINMAKQQTYDLENALKNKQLLKLLIYGVIMMIFGLVFGYVVATILTKAPFLI